MKWTAPATKDGAIASFVPTRCAVGPRKIMVKIYRTLFLLIASGPFVAGCASNGGNAHRDDSTGAFVRAVQLADSVTPAPQGQPVTLAAAKNEWTDFAMKIGPVPAGDGKNVYSFRFHSL